MAKSKLPKAEILFRKSLLIRLKRLQKGETLGEFAEKLNICPNYLNQLEMQSAILSDRLWNKFCARFKMVKDIHIIDDKFNDLVLSLDDEINKKRKKSKKVS